MTAVRKTALISIEDYLEGELRSPIKHEYLGGVIYAMAGARNVHNQIATRLVSLLDRQLRGRPCQPFNSDTKVRVRLSTQTRFYYPDGMIVCHPNSPTESFQDNPVVIAEVLSEATRRIDEGEKRDAYLTIPSLMAYLLIDSDRMRVVLHRRTEHGFIAEAYEDANATIDLPDVGCAVSLTELYERADFSEQQE